jgi:hypothetical protein
MRILKHDTRKQTRIIGGSTGDRPGRFGKRGGKDRSWNTMFHVARLAGPAYLCEFVRNNPKPQQPRHGGGGGF